MSGSLALAALGTAAGCGGVGQAGRRRAAPHPQPVMLVHGAWHGGWCWDWMKRESDSSSLSLHAPTLSGLGDRASELSADISLETHISDIADYIMRRDLRDIILLGHSYGGMIITAIADRMKDRIAHIIYLDAALPADGQSMISYDPAATPETIADTAAALRAIAPDGIALPPFAPEVFGIPVSHPDYALIKARLTPHPLKTWLDPVALTNGGSTGLPRTFVHCVNPVLPRTAFPRIAAHVSRDPSWQYFELQTGHDAMITNPAGVTDIVRQAAHLEAI